MGMRLYRNLAAGLAALALAGQEIPDQTFRTTVNVVIAPTTVVDSDGRYVHGLRPDQFRLYDNRQLQDIKVDVAFQPISLVVAVQADAVVDGVLPKIQKIGPLLQPLVFGAQGEAAIVAFDHRIEVKQDFTSDGQRLIDGLKKIRAGSSSSRLIDAVNESVRMLRRRPANHRKVILLISESRDKSSEGRTRETLASAEFQNISLYAVNIPRLLTAATASARAPRPNPVPAAAGHVPAGAALTPDSAAGARNYGNVLPAFEEIIRGVKAIFIPNPVEVFTKFTGGREYSFMDQKALESAVSAVGDELHSQYLITYSPSNKLEGGYHEITVTVEGRPDLKARTRPGYWLAAVPQ